MRSLLLVCVLVVAAGCREGPTLDLGDDGERAGADGGQAGHGPLTSDASSEPPQPASDDEPDEAGDASTAERDGQAGCDEGRCGECEHCTDPGAPVCDEEGRCVECTEDEHCPADSSCDTDSGNCV